MTTFDLDVKHLTREQARAAYYAGMVAGGGSIAYTVARWAQGRKISHESSALRCKSDSILDTLLVSVMLVSLLFASVNYQLLSFTAKGVVSTVMTTLITLSYVYDTFSGVDHCCATQGAFDSQVLGCIAKPVGTINKDPVSVDFCRAVFFLWLALYGQKLVAWWGRLAAGVTGAILLVEIYIQPICMKMSMETEGFFAPAPNGHFCPAFVYQFGVGECHDSPLPASIVHKVTVTIFHYALMQAYATRMK